MISELEMLEERSDIAIDALYQQLRWLDREQQLKLLDMVLNRVVQFRNRIDELERKTNERR
jgi:hypothetical protein